MLPTPLSVLRKYCRSQRRAWLEAPNGWPTYKRNYIYQPGKIPSKTKQNTNRRRPHKSGHRMRERKKIQGRAEKTAKESNKMPATWHRGSCQVLCRPDSLHSSQVRAADFWPGPPIFRADSRGVLPYRMFPQQINTTFDTSLLCPQRNRINSIPGPWPAKSGLVMVSKVLGPRPHPHPHSHPDPLSLSQDPRPVHCSPRAPRLKAACPVDTFA